MTQRTRLLLAALAAVVLLAVAGLAGAWIPESNHALSSGDASATVTLTHAADLLWWANDGANPVVVRAWSGCETPAVITSTTSGSVRINAGEKASIPRISGCGLGIIAFSHITTGAGLTTVSRWYAQ